MHTSALTRAAAASALIAISGHAAAACDGSSDPCSLDLGRITVDFSQGAASYVAEALVLYGSDAYYGAASGFLPSVQAIHGADVDGFAFSPQVYASVGGSGINGYHEVHASFEFSDIGFFAKPGYRIDSIDFVVTGSTAWVGDAYASFGLPAAMVFNGNDFSASGSWGAGGSTSFRGEFNVSASYLQGDDGTAISYGTANASFDRVSFTAHVSAVPEPQAAALLWAGLGLLACRRRPRG
jgi:hypothetical protein